MQLIKLKALTNDNIQRELARYNVSVSGDCLPKTMAELALLDAAIAEVAFGRCCTPMCFRPDSGHPRCRPQTCSSKRHRVQFATAFTMLNLPAATASIKSSY